MRERTSLTLPILGFEGGLGLVSVGLSVLFGLAPWTTITLTWAALAAGVLAAAPMVALLVVLLKSTWSWARRLHDFVSERIRPLFAGVSGPAVALIALFAGVFEELLFRGVIQGGLRESLGPWSALLLASLLFGLAHAMTRTYFWLASLIGLYLGWLYLWTENLLVPMLAHFLYDWIALHWYLSQSKRWPLA